MSLPLNPSVAAMRVNQDNKVLRSQLRLMGVQLAEARKGLTHATDLLLQQRRAIDKLKELLNVNTRNGDTP